jgi:hypothetical protein
MTTTTTDPDYDPIAERRHWITVLTQAPLYRQAGLAWVHRHGQHPPTCAVAQGERCNCGLALLMGRKGQP